MKRIVSITVLFVLLFSGCSLIDQKNEITISITDSGNTTTYNVPAGSTVGQALDYVHIPIDALDRTDPSQLSLLSDGATVKIVRVKEEFDITESVLPFEQQTVKNESIAEGQTILIQSGVNGLQQSTYRIVLEDGIEVSRTLVKTEVVKPAKPEIVMIGVQSPFTAVPINGMIAYISSSNAWIMENNTGNRRVIVSTGDLDGRIFSLSPDHKWLLFSRTAAENETGVINSLWIVDVTQSEPTPIDTTLRNVVHYADWVPGKVRTFTYSTVEPRSVAPGWQANNDLQMFTFDEEGKKINNKLIVDTNSGGQYGWWGITYQWSMDGSKIAYSRPDSIGLVDLSEGGFKSIIDFSPYQPKSDWAWVPSLSWSEDNQILFTELSADVLGQNGSAGPLYNLVAILLETGNVIPLVESCGLFCYPVLSPIDSHGHYLIGYLSSIIPEQSETSRYNLKVMDRDGSNPSKLYPGEGIQGLDPQLISWSPFTETENDRWIAFITQGNIMLVDTSTSTLHQVSGDGSVTKMTWR